MCEVQGIFVILHTYGVSDLVASSRHACGRFAVSAVVVHGGAAWHSQIARGQRQPLRPVARHYGVDQKHLRPYVRPVQLAGTDYFGLHAHSADRAALVHVAHLDVHAFRRLFAVCRSADRFRSTFGDVLLWCSGNVWIAVFFPRTMRGLWFLKRDPAFWLTVQPGFGKRRQVRR